MNAAESIDSRQLMNDLLHYKHLDQEKVLSLSQMLYDYAVNANDEYAKSYALLYFSFGNLGLYKLVDCIHYGQQGYLLQKKNEYYDLLQLQLNVLGNAFMYKADFQTAMKYFTEALYYAKMQNDNPLLGAIYYNLADLYKSVGSYDRALDCYKHSYEMMESISDNPLNISIDYSDYYLILAKISVCLNDYDKATEYLQKCRMISTSEEVPHDLDFSIRILEAKILHANSFHSAEVIQKIKDTFHILEITASHEYIDIFHAYYDGIYMLFENDAFSLCEKYMIKLLHVVEYLDLPEFWLRYYDLSIQVTEALLACSASDHLNYPMEQEHLFHSYEQFYHYSILRDHDIVHEQLLRLKDLVDLHEAQKQNNDYRHNVSSLKLQTEQDELSGCSNKNGLNAFLNTYFDYFKQSALRFSCILLDIDYFKQYNDNYGHLAGDECVRKVSSILKKAAGKEGFLARFGGDEFILIFTDKSNDELLSISQTIKCDLTDLHIPHAFSNVAEYVTLTQGLVNRIPVEGEKTEDLLRIADQALYQVKKEGRNNYLLMTDQYD